MEQEKEKKPIYKKVWFWVIIVVIVGIIAASAGGSGDEENKKSQYAVGDTAEQNDVKVTLTEVITSEGDGEFIVPDEGNEFVICKFEIKNDSDESVAVSSLMCFESYCDDVSITEDIMGATLPEAEESGQLDGDVGAGKKMKGAIVYQVPKGWKDIEVNVNLDLLDDEAIKFVAENK